jgi:DNA-binding CsgD family transcriptional regulator
MAQTESPPANEIRDVVGRSVTSDFLALTIHTTLAALPANSFDATRLVGRLADDLASPATLHVDRLAALAFFGRLTSGVSQPELDGLAHAVVRQHELVRAVAPLAATPLAWIDLFCRTWASVHPVLRWSTRCSGDRLSVHFAAPHDSVARGFRLFSRAVLRHAPTVIGMRPLAGLPVSSEDPSTAVFTLPASMSAAARIRCSTDIPLRTVLAAFRAYGESTVGFDEVCVGSVARPAVDAIAALAGRHDLTPAETRVLRALDEGLPPAGIGARLGVATGTVRVHLKRLYAKTGARGQRRLLAHLASARALATRGGD